MQATRRVLSPQTCIWPTAWLQFKPFKNLSKYLENEGGQNGGRDINISKAFHSLASVGAFRFQFVSRFSFPFLLLLSGLWTLDTGHWTVTVPWPLNVTRCLSAGPISLHLCLSGVHWKLARLLYRNAALPSRSESWEFSFNTL